MPAAPTVVDDPKADVPAGAFPAGRDARLYGRRGRPPLPPRHSPEKMHLLDAENNRVNTPEDSNLRNSGALPQNPAALPRISKANQEILCHGSSILLALCCLAEME
jgi:hypothetical protein